ncbi:tetratricopeptide repeat protein [Bathymodiolus septemdierum thioautotrophic gill symbiont]|uniref:FRG domain-containing protein n=1 Tax=endosymbiont of Bathymodiolus septemdierum str. Myojin knoll TaxID=1303921 RepID=A0A0P0UT24_9GAMM|nr:tetratricopeptide repeat protein [Bathymodiolus septemdierum thioautotrophic gill symbiont]BAS68313.1 hypothetical protein BSEPE_1330 [endosymbiont of Bathymodiolus septemdierum str. Myojin knoll]
MTTNNEKNIKTVSDFQKQILKLKGSFAYRGQGDKTWGVESGAYRRLEGNVNQDLIKYTENIINQAKNYTQEIASNNDLELLAELQHYGCATPLIDFSLNALTALWFACEDTKEDGKVVCLKVDDKARFLEVSGEDKNKLLSSILSLSIRDGITYTLGKWQPPLNNSRIVKQDSLFIFTASGEIKDNEFEAILIIDKDSKLTIRGELEQLCGITQTSIYPDFYGFATSNSAVKTYREPTVEELIKRADKDYQQGEYKKAIEYYELALASDLKTYGEAHPSVATCRNNLGMAWESLGEYKKAIEYYELALASDLKTYGEAHPSVATRRNNLGMAWQSLGEYKKAIEYLELALASDLKTYGEAHPSVATCRNNLGVAWQSLGEYKKAIEYYELALASNLKTYGEAHPDVANRRNNLGMAWQSLGEYKKAIEYYELALATLQKTLGDEHPTTKQVSENLANVLTHL